MNPLHVHQDAIDALCKESSFWIGASKFMLDHGYWVLITDKTHQVLARNQ